MCSEPKNARGEEVVVVDFGRTRPMGFANARANHYHENIRVFMNSSLKSRTDKTGTTRMSAGPCCPRATYISTHQKVSENSASQSLEVCLLAFCCRKQMEVHNYKPPSTSNACCDLGFSVRAVGCPFDVHGGVDRRTAKLSDGQQAAGVPVLLPERADVRLGRREAGPHGRPAG